MNLNSETLKNRYNRQKAGPVGDFCPPVREVSLSFEAVENLIVVAFDGLSAAFLEPYGNRWVPTPSWSELSASGMAAEWFMAESNELDAVYQSYWFGRHRLAKTRGTESLAKRMADSGRLTLCMTDTPKVAKWAEAAGFDETEEPISKLNRASVNSWEETAAAQWMMTGAARLTSCERPFFAWLHIDSMSNSWQAPYAWRERFVDEEDPPPPDFLQPPIGTIADSADPDELLGWTHAYAAEVMLTDACLSLLLDGLSESGLDSRTAVIVTSPRGFAIGDHGVIGMESGILHQELTHVPFILRSPGDEFRLMRRHGLFQSSDLYATCLSLLGQSTDQSWSQSLANESNLPDRAVATQGDYRALRTPAWSCTWDQAGEFGLYVKPDDRWDVNEIAQRRPEIQPLAEDVYRDFLMQAECGNRSDLMELPPQLLDVGE